MGDYGRISNFNPDANFSLVRFGGNTPVTELELNESQLILANRLKEITQTVMGDRFLEGGTITLNTQTNEFEVRNQSLINEGRHLYISTLKGTLNSDETIYLDIYEQEITKDSVIKKFGNLQETQTVPNTLLDPRLEGIETARRTQVCFDLVKETSRYEMTSTDPIINIGGVDHQCLLGMNSKLLSMEGNSYQDPTTLNIEFVGVKNEDGKYEVDIITTGENLFNLNTEYEGTTYSITGNTLKVIPKSVNSWNGLTCKLTLKKNTDYTFQCKTEGKSMVQILDVNKQLLALGNKTSFNTGDNDFIYIVFYSGCGKTTEGEYALFSNILLTEGTVYQSYSQNKRSELKLILNQPVAKVGRYKDILFQNSSNEWNILKNTKTTLFNGNEVINGKGWTLALEGTTTNCFKLEKAGTPSHNNDEVETNLCNYALPKSYNTIWTTEEIGCAFNMSGDLVIRLSKELAPTLEVFKNLLKTKAMEVTYPIYTSEIEEDVEVENMFSRYSLEPHEEEVNVDVEKFTYTGVGSSITIQETKNGYTNNVVIEGNTVYSLPLNFSNSPYQTYNKEDNTITNNSKVEYRNWEEVETLYVMDRDTDYTLTFTAVTPLMCEIPCAKEYPTVQQGETYILNFNSKDVTDFKIKLWSPNTEQAGQLKDLQLFVGTYKTVPKVKSLSNEQGLFLQSRGENDGELDVQPLMYNYRGNYVPLTYVRSLPSGETDTVMEHDDSKYYFHKRIEQVTFTGRERYELVGTTPTGKLIIDSVKTYSNAKPTVVGNTFCDRFNAKANVDTLDIKGMCITESGKIRVVIDPKDLVTPDTSGLAKYFTDNKTTLTYELSKEEVYLCNMFDTKIFIGTTVVTLGGSSSPSKFTCTVRENEGLEVYTFNNTTNMMFTGLAPSKVVYVANFKPRLPQQDGHVYIPIASRVRGELIDLRIFDPNIVDYVNEAKDLTTGVYTVVKALRQNGTLKYSSTLSDKDERGNYTTLTVRHYDITGQVMYRMEKFRLNYDLDGDIISKELIKSW